MANEEIIELKPCPLCGGEARTCQEYRSNGYVKAVVIQCKSCEMTLEKKGFVTEWEHNNIPAEAAAAWNRRYQENRLTDSENKAFFTPGPWMKGNPFDAIIASPEAEKKMIGKPFPVDKETLEYYGGHVICESVNACNRDLIIAAPDLYEALKHAVAWLTETIEGKSVPQVDGEPGAWLHEARKALDRAEGRALNA